MDFVIFFNVNIENFTQHFNLVPLILASKGNCPSLPKPLLLIGKALNLPLDRMHYKILTFKHGDFHLKHYSQLYYNFTMHHLIKCISYWLSNSSVPMYSTSWNSVLKNFLSPFTLPWTSSHPIEPSSFSLLTCLVYSHSPINVNSQSLSLNIFDCFLPIENQFVPNMSTFQNQNQLQARWSVCWGVIWSAAERLKQGNPAVWLVHAVKYFTCTYVCLLTWKKWPN